MKIKICGLKNQENILSLSRLNLDMMGFIFYAGSPRFVGGDVDSTILQSLPRSIERVGVFVDEKINVVLKNVNIFHLSLVQLHGNESVIYCKKIADKMISVIKAFSIDDQFDFDQLKSYQQVCDYFLFDTKGKNKGGNGISFDWEILNCYKLNTPFLLSGGIGIDNIETALKLSHPQLKGFDINSRIETEPGLKSIEETEKLIKKIRTHEFY